MSTTHTVREIYESRDHTPTYTWQHAPKVGDRVLRLGGWYRVERVEQGETWTVWLVADVDEERAVEAAQRALDEPGPLAWVRGLCRLPGAIARVFRMGGSDGSNCELTDISTDSRRTSSRQ